MTNKKGEIDLRTFPDFEKYLYESDSEQGKDDSSVGSSFSFIDAPMVTPDGVEVKEGDEGLVPSATPIVAFDEGNPDGFTHVVTGSTVNNPEIPLPLPPHERTAQSTLPPYERTTQIPLATQLVEGVKSIFKTTLAAVDYALSAPKGAPATSQPASSATSEKYLGRDPYGKTADPSKAANEDGSYGIQFR